MTTRDTPCAGCGSFDGHRLDCRGVSGLKQPGAHNALPRPALPTDKAARKAIPLARGLLDYFPAACAEVAHVSQQGNEQHNPGQPMHHARGKSSDHADCILRHLADRGSVDEDGLRHSAKVAWRALALLQEELEAAGAPLARGAKLPDGPAEQLALRDHPLLQPEPGLYECMPDGTVKFTPYVPLISEPSLKPGKRIGE